MKKLSLVLFGLLVGIFYDDQLLLAAAVYKIDVQPVNIYLEPRTNSEIVHSLYQAENIKVLQLRGKWAQVQLKINTKTVLGWVDKLSLSTQLVQQELTNSVLNQYQATQGKLSETKLATNNYGAKAVNSGLYCTKSNNKALVNGCVVDIDVEVIGPVEAGSARVSCQAEFEITLVTGELKQVWEQKKILTPMKKGEGAARIQIAILPLAINSVKLITLVSYQCRLEKLF